jgi:2'-hydroxyisoflavone reductase
MTTSRREFLTASIAVPGALAALGAFAAGGADPAKAGKSESKSGGAVRPMRVLILGGTGFIGPHQVRYAVSRGHKVTVFNRGRKNDGLPPEVERLEGDRNGKLDALKGRDWDAVIDNPSTLPRWVRDAAQLLKDSAGQYLFISTISVYADNSRVGMTEDAPLIRLDDPTVEEVTGATYGGLKALAESEAERAFPGRTTVIRPGLIVGPGDETDRFTYWPVRVARGGEVLAPGSPGDPVQFIDVRDIAEWTIRAVEQKAFGTYNALGPASPLSMAEMLYAMRGVMPGSLPIQFKWVPAEFLEAQSVRPWSDMPVWIPPAGAYAGAGSVSNARAVAAGLTFRSLADTTRATLEYVNGRDAKRNEALQAGLAPAREQQVLAAWNRERMASAKSARPPA